ncbi:hypothetical protein E8E12_009569 [Didymella heteroderae]|uniref:Opioid growth factor receptor (OGFr) conserved domain-containing protein n=1 Tax=Didymella heteroderae TaxID=1769908 RepID=A0A9P4WS85_9PLEO|nr:hypothetical protein E8E12_009569 [Didymella heteroderae]
MASPKQPSIVRFYDPDIKAKDALGRTQEQILAWPNSQLENSHNYIQMLFPLPEGSPFNYAAPIIDLETMKAFRSNSELRQRLRASFERMLTFYGFATSIHPEPECEEKKDVEEPKQSSTEEAFKTIQATSNTEGSASELQIPVTATSETTTETAIDTVTAGAASDKPDSSARKPSSRASPFSYYVVRGPNFPKASRNWAVRMDHNHLRITRILRCLRVLGLQKECEAFFAALKRVYDDPTVNIGPRSLEFWTRAVERPLYMAPDGEECDWLEAWEKEQQEEMEHQEAK